MHQHFYITMQAELPPRKLSLHVTEGDLKLPMLSIAQMLYLCSLACSAFSYCPTLRIQAL